MSVKIVLVVDDSIAIRKQVKMILENKGYQVREAGNELGVMNNVELYGILADLILMDLSLKNENGFDVIYNLKNQERYKDIPVVMLTENASASQVKFAKDLGVQGYLLKPIIPERLIQCVEKI